MIYSICAKLLLMRKWVFLCLLFLPFLSSAAEREIRIGLIDTLDQDFYLETFVPTIEHMQKTLKDYKVTVVELQQNNLLANVVKERPDFLVSSAGNFVTLISKLGAQQIATVSRNHAYSPKEAVSSVFIVRNDRKDLQKISDLKGKVLSATEPHDFDGMLVGMGEIATRGFEPDTFFSKTLFSHYQYPDVATYVKVGAADVGILGTCQYEKLLTTGQIQPGEFRVLEAKNNTEACIRSTERYPDTVFYALDTAPIDEVKAVSLSLLSMPKGEFDFEWVPASGFLKVYDLMKSLKLGPYEHLRETTVKDFILSHQKELLLAALLLCAILVHVVRVNWLVNRRTEELKFALAVQRATERKARENRQKLDLLEKSRVISQMSSIFAHEVKQPITNLIYYASALSLLLQQLGVKDDRVEYALKQMNSQAKRTSDIVEHVRSYAKHKANRSEVFNLVEVIRRTINSINKEEIEGVQTTANLPQEAIAVGDSFEIELAVLNVLKNALKAAKNSLNPQTSVSVTAQKHMWKITITDNGPKISEEIFSALGRPTSTSKKDGLGVGLSIVLSIIENNGGHLTFRRIEPNGIAVDLFVKKKEE